MYDDKKRKPPKPTGIVYSKAEKAAQRQAIKQVYIEGTRDVATIQRVLRSRETNPISLNQGTIRKRLDDVIAEMEKQQNEEGLKKGARRQSQLTRLHNLRLKCVAAKDYRTAAMIEKQIALIEGNEAPIRVEVDEVQTAALRQVIGQMTAKELVEEFHRAQEEERELMSLRELRDRGLLVEGHVVREDGAAE